MRVVLRPNGMQISCKRPVKTYGSLTRSALVGCICGLGGTPAEPGYWLLGPSSALAQTSAVAVSTCG